MLVTVIQSTNVTVTHNTDKETLTDLYDVIDIFRQNTGVSISLPIQSDPTRTVIYVSFMDVSETGEADDSFQDSVLQLVDSLEDAGFTVQS